MEGKHIGSSTEEDYTRYVGVQKSIATSIPISEPPPIPNLHETILRTVRPEMVEHYKNVQLLEAGISEKQSISHLKEVLLSAVESLDGKTVVQNKEKRYLDNYSEVSVLLAKIVTIFDSYNNQSPQPTKLPE